MCPARTRVAWKWVSALIQAAVSPAFAIISSSARSPAATSSSLPTSMARVMPTVSSQSRRSASCPTDCWLRLSIRSTEAARLNSGLRRTYAPEPRRDSTSPLTTRIRIAWLTVGRLVPVNCTRSRSEGSLVPSVRQAVTINCSM